MRIREEEAPPQTPDAPPTDRASERSALLAKRLAAVVAGRNRPQGIPKRTTAVPPPLSFVQERIWLHCRYHPEDDDHAYHRLLAVTLPPTVNAAALEQSLCRVCRRHEALRTTFSIQDGQPVQIIGTDATVALRVIPVATVRETEWEAEVTRIAREETHRPFDLETGPLFRACLIENAVAEPRPVVLLLTLHHLISDGWSDNILLRELLASYAALTSPESGNSSYALPNAEPQYGDFVLWQRERMQSEALVRQRTYWRERLAQTLPVLDLPADRPRPFAVTARGARCRFTLDPDVAAALGALGPEEGCTLFMTLLTGFKTLLHRDCGQADISIVSPMAGRTHVDTENMIGCFINSLVLRTDLAGDPTFREALQRVRTTCLEAFSNQEVPFETIIAETPMLPGVRSGDLFRVLFQLRNVPKRPSIAGDLPAERRMPDVGIALYDLNVEFYENEGGLHGFIDYKTDLFDPATIAGLVRRFQTLLAGATAAPETPLSRLPLLSESERLQRLPERNDPGTASPQNRCLPQLFEEQVERTPEAIAVTCEGQTLSYAQLNTRANQLAHLLRKRGVGPEVLVGLCVERSLEMVVGVLGILKAGGAYVPLDPSYPPDRLAFMVEDAQLALTVTQRSTLSRLPTSDMPVVCLDDIAALEAESAENPTVALTPNNLAYVIYTSGSTGRPKGAMISHANVARLMAATWDWFRFDAHDVWTLFHSLSFDFSVWELWGPLLYGGKLVVVPFWVSRTPEAFYRLLVQEGVTVLNQTMPSAFRQLLSQIPADDTGLALRWVIFGGEALEPVTLQRWYTLYGAEDRRLINMYGITETTVHVTYRQMRAEDVVSGRGSLIGAPIPDLQLYVLTPDLELTPTGIAGELYVSGAGLARGYLGHTELTAERFIPNPFGKAEGERLYKTGDLARYLPDGELEYLGRADQQVKIRGFRIELGEIENVLVQHPQLREAVVLVREDLPGDKRLLAYLVGSEGAMSASALREHLREKLPDYMLPAAFVFLEALPLTLNGKIDRKALPAPDRAEPETPGAFAAPRAPIEAKLAEIWQEVLGVDHLSAETDFFEIGGHSLLATKVMARIRSAFQIALPLRALFEAPTLSGLAAVVAQAKQGIDLMDVPESSNPELNVPIVSRCLDAPCALSFEQQRLWFLDRLIPDSAQYLIPTPVRLHGELNTDALQRALDAIVERHSILRTTYLFTGVEPLQTAQPLGHIVIERLDLSEVAPDEREKAAQDRLHEGVRRPLDLTQDCMLRASLVRMGTAEHLLLLTTHHIASDAWSEEILFRELGALYSAFCQGKPSPLPALPFQYADFAVWQRQWLTGNRLERQFAYWKTQLAGAPAVLALPTDRPRPELPTSAGAVATLALPATLLPRLQALSQAQGTTLFMTLLASFQVLLARYSGQDDIVVGTPIANRPQQQLEDLIGFFLNTLAMRGDLSGDPSFLELLGRVRETALSAYAHQDLPFEKLVEELQPERSLQHTPLFQVMFVLQNSTQTALEMTGLRATLLPRDIRYARFDLTLFAFETEAGLELSVQYATDLFDATTIERLLAHFRILLEGIVADPQQCISRLPLLSLSEQQQLLAHNGIRTDATHDRCIPRLFEEQAQRTPAAIAVECVGQQFTYAELNARANQWANTLCQSGVAPNTLVGLMGERSLEMVIGLLAILKAGGVYLPLDPADPPERLQAILADTRPSLLLIQDRFRERLASVDCPVLSLEQEPFRNTAESQETPRSAAAAEDLAYVMFTSGSTGRPKGVAVTHRGVVRLVKNADYCHLGPDEVMLQLAPLAFDASTFEIWGSLLNGGKLVIVAGQTPSLEDLGALIRAQKVTTLWLTAGLFHAMVDHQLGSLTGVRQLLAGGDVLSPSHVARALRHLPGCRLINGYGPTENTTFTCCYEVPDDFDGSTSLPIGRAIRHTQAYVLDTHRQLVPVGVAGELYIGGAGLARGYLNQPELTAEKFVPDPFHNPSGARLYRTGDLARLLPDGNLEFLGRIDHQVKIRGFRIELGEIEAVLAQYPQVRESVVVARKDVPGDKRLVAYLVGSEDEVGTSALREHLREKLPDYMMPAAFVFLEDLPLTTNGKIDRAALPSPDLERLRDLETSIAPRSAVEARLAGVWQEVLGLGALSVESSFFELGGHSLLAIRLLSEVKREFDVSLSLAEMFKAPTVSRMAQLLQRKQTGEEGWSPLVPLQPQGKRLPLFCAPVAGGSAFHYRTLAAHIGADQPVYAFEPRGMNGVGAPHETVEEMAAYYIQHMRTVQTDGPYHLCGFSFGGTVAFEMACQLRRAGQQVGCLILFDSWAPGYPIPRRTSGPKNLRDRSSVLAYKIGFQTENLAACRTLIAKLTYVHTAGERLLGRLRAGRGGSPWKPSAENPSRSALPEALQAVKRAEAKAREIYCPESYSGPILLLKARLPRPDLEIEPLSGWDSLSSHIEVISTPGTHFSILEEPCVHMTLSHVLKTLKSTGNTLPPSSLQT